MSIGSSFGGAVAPSGSGVDPFAGIGGARRDPESRFGEISSEDFINLMLAELTNQDPTEPQDTQALLDQISAIRSIESDTSMIDRLGSLVDQSSFASASNLIGAIVQGISDRGGIVTDLVLSVSQTRDGPLLNLVSGDRVRLDGVLEVGAPIFDDSPPPITPPAGEEETPVAGGDDAGTGDPDPDEPDPDTGADTTTGGEP